MMDRLIPLTTKHPKTPAQENPSKVGEVMNPEPEDIALKKLCLPEQGLRYVWVYGAGVGVGTKCLIQRPDSFLNSKSFQKPLAKL